MHYRLLIIAISLILLSVPTSRAQDNQLNIVTTTTQATDLTKVLVGDLINEHINITGLMGAGVDPHLYQPNEANIRAMNESDLIIYSGLNLEGQFGVVLDKLGEQGKRIHRLSHPVKRAGYIIGNFDLSEEYTNVDDPHFWFDPRNWQLTTLELAEVLADMDPDHAQIYLENAATYNNQLSALYDWGVTAMLTVPEEQRILVTSHDAFQYFGVAFDWEVRGLQGISTESEAGVADVQNIAQIVIESQIPVMFVESSVSPAAIQAVQEAVNAGGGQVGIGIRELYSDAMGDPDTFYGTYIGMITTNILTILESYQRQGFDISLPAYPAEQIGIELPSHFSTAFINEPNQ